MKKLFGWLVVTSFITSFGSCADNTHKINGAAAGNSANNIHANVDDLCLFFDTKIGLEDRPQLMFFENDKYEPIRWISVTDYELKNSSIKKMEAFTVLILDNPAESSVNLFCKHNGQKVNGMVENKYFPDNIVMKSLNDTLVVCQLFWKYDLGSNINDIWHYYFIGAKNGFYNHAYSCVESSTPPLDLENFVVTDNGILFKEHTNRGFLLALPDTLQLVNPSKHDEVFEPNIISFDNVRFGSM